MKWKTIKTHIIEANEHLRFFVDEFDADDKVGKYWYHTNAYGDEAVSVFVRTQDGRFVMTREYRYLFNDTTVSMPQGSIEQGESALSAARREAIEESGYAPGQLVDLGWFATAPAFSKERARLFLALDSTFVGQNLDEHEQIDTILMSPEQIDVAIENGEIWDGQGIAGWYKVRSYLKL